VIELQVLTREQCPLCEEFVADVQTVLAQGFFERFRLVILDVDDDPVHTRRYGLKIPVLLAQGELLATAVCDAVDLSARLRRLAE
jgi:Glutaredoxin-like domain (DUF836)